jgi:hypothetical protein
MNCCFFGDSRFVSAYAAFRMAVWLAFGLAMPNVFTADGAATNWQPGPGCRWTELPVPKAGRTGFTLVDGASSGILFTNLLADEHSLTNRNLLSGSGVAAGDVDGDGLVDLYFCGLDNHNALYRNLGNWKFQDITAEAGVACPGQYSTAAVFADLDGDGDLDLLVNSLGGGTRIFENDGKGRFTEVTDAAGARSRTGSMSMALADIDGDGTLDLYVANFRPDTIRDEPMTKFHGQMLNGRPVITAINDKPVSLPEYTNRFVLAPSGAVLEFGQPDVLYLNDGKGRLHPVSFTDGTFRDEEGRALAEPPRDWGLAVQFHDIDGDGAPDIYVCNDLFTPDRIWINDGHGKFRALPRLALRNTSTFSMGVDFADIDRDGNVDFFVVDMLSRDHRKRQVQVSEMTPSAPLVGLIDDRPQVLRNNLQVNRGDTTFAEVTYYAGVEASEWSWGPIFLDVDLDGLEDILISNGQLRDFQNIDMANRLEALRAAGRLSRAELLNLMRSYPGLLSAKVAFHNLGHWRFEEKGAEWGFNTTSISQGMCLADLDGDGDLDVVVNNLNGVAGVYRNEGVGARVAVRLKGKAPNTRGIGAKVYVYGGAVPMQSQEMICGGRYLSSDDAMRVFAAGALTNEMRMEVRWRSGRRSVINGVKANRLYEIDEAGAEESGKLNEQSSREGTTTNEQKGRLNVEHRTVNVGQAATQNPQPTSGIAERGAQTPEAVAGAQVVYEDVSGMLGHRHHEEPFDDFERQPLLANKLSQLGPGVCWYDVDGDGREDLVIGSGRGGRLGVYVNKGEGRFERWEGAPFEKVLTRDQTTVLGAGFGLLAGSANYEDGLTNGGCVRIYDAGRKVSGESVLGQGFSVGPLALGDVDGDGALDLFVGGRVVAGRYPEGADSLLMRNEGGRLVMWQRFEKVGLVSGALFSDLDGDGKPELILACEWGPVKVYRQEGGRYELWDAPLSYEDTRPGEEASRLSQLSGWWRGVTTGDLDGDGRMDIVVSNWGLNSKYRTRPGHGCKLYYGSMEGGGGKVDLVETYYDEGMKAEVPQRDLRVVGAALPFVREKYGSYEEYGKASVQEIYGSRLKAMGVVEVRRLESVVLMNRGDHFEVRVMPAEAQLAPGFAVCVGDYDGDGKEDVFMSQNFFAVAGDSSRCDGGRGLWMRGDGRGKLEAVAGQQSGVKVYGEGRGAALCDYDGDGRVDLVVGQNGAETKLYHNVGARVGLRVRLKGPAGNASGVGAQMRLKFGQRAGPVREIHGGSGYWSQDSAVQVLGTPEPPTSIWVRWPGGQVTSSEVPAKAREIAVDPSGKLEVLK